MPLSVMICTTESIFSRLSEPKDLAERFTKAGMPVGAADKVRDLIAQWEEAGVDRFYVRQMELDDLDLLDEKLTALGG